MLNEPSIVKDVCMQAFGLLPLDINSWSALRLRQFTRPTCSDALLDIWPLYELH